MPSELSQAKAKRIKRTVIKNMKTGKSPVSISHQKNPWRNLPRRLNPKKNPWKNLPRRLNPKKNPWKSLPRKLNP